MHGAARVPGGLGAPYDTVHFRLFHPARRDGSDRERLTGEVAPDLELAPWPLLVWLPGINVGADGYRWLAVELAMRGTAVVTLELVTELLPGQIGISPGLDLDACRAETFGSAPSATAVRPVLDAVERLVAAGPLAGSIDLARVVLGGHSAGGTVALLNANPSWFPLAGVVTYGAHTMASTMVGHPPETVLALPGALPTLLMGGELDGVVAASAERYEAGATHDPIRRTFDEAVAGGRGDAALAVLRGATHTVISHPSDETTARGFLDPSPSRDGSAIRAAIGGLVGEFVDAHVRGIEGAGARLGAWLEDGEAVVVGLVK